MKLTKGQRESLVAPALYYLRHTTKPKLLKILDCLRLAHEQFKDSKTNHDGMVSVATTGGLLAKPATFEGIEFYGWVHLKQARETSPWQCAGPFIADPLALTIHLWTTNYAPMHGVVDEFGVQLVISVALASNYQTATLDSLLQANGLLCDFVSAAAGEWEKLAKEAARHIDGTIAEKNKAWKQIQQKGVAKLKQMSGGDTCLRLATYYKRNNPFAKKPEVVVYVFNRIREPDYCLKKSASTIGRLIAGYEVAASAITSQSDQ